jgi:ceramide glucosyltransferase
MASTIQSVTALAALGAAVTSLLYLTVCVLLLLSRRRRSAGRAVAQEPPMTVLKPLCGAEPGLEDNLRSFCSSAGPGTQLLLGARDADDPALAIARRVIAEFPAVDAEVVVGAPTIGLNAKVNTLARLAPLARHELLVIADSDTRVGPGDLTRVVTPLLTPAVGVVSCLFRSRPTDTFWSRLGALSIDEWFMPSVLVSRALQSPAYCSGPMVAIRREVLNAIGGFSALASMLADDYELGARVRRLGFQSVIADCEVTVTVDEHSCAGLSRHEVRWMRTVRTVTPIGHAFSVLTYTIPLAAVACVATGASPASLALLGLAVGLRAAVHWIVGSAEDGTQRPPSPPAPLWMVVLRDFFSLAMWVSSYGSRAITWRGRTLWVGSDGILRTRGDGRARGGICGRMTGGLPSSPRSI